MLDQTSVFARFRSGRWVGVSCRIIAIRASLRASWRSVLRVTFFHCQASTLVLQTNVCSFFLVTQISDTSRRSAGLDNDEIEFLRLQQRFKEGRRGVDGLKAVLERDGVI